MLTPDDPDATPLLNERVKMPFAASLFCPKLSSFHTVPFGSGWLKLMQPAQSTMSKTQTDARIAVVGFMIDIMFCGIK